ncbi:MAG: glycosyltransferase family 4 protein [Flavobacteriales bacterium]|nr:glycosyltransferase family 4 protein [Flavobacteriales bacterium]MCB9168463.1 glycosyltransferase family 4 protein [Flavobacteriales bacterium]
MSDRRTAKPRVLVLYTELAPYFLAGVRRLVHEHGACVHIVHWPVNREAPFALGRTEGITLVERVRHDDRELLRTCVGWSPDIVLCSGWVDKGYLKVCREMHRRGVPTVMCSDTAWRGSWRQWVALFAVQTWLRRTFSHAWVTGGPQARYAHYLGFDRKRIRTGFYAADVDVFAPLAQLLDGPKRDHFPHRLLCVARYIPTKGQQLLCDVFAGLCDAGHARDWDLWLVGTGELHDQVMGSTSGSHPRIRHVGFVQADRMPEVMAQCGVFVLPSTYEPWGVVVQEHAVAGFPLVLSDAVGAAERFLAEPFNGHRFIAGDPTSLAEALSRILNASDDALIAMARHSVELGRAWGPGDWARTVVELITGP